MAAVIDASSAGSLDAPNSLTNQAGPFGWAAEAISGRSEARTASECSSWAAQAAVSVGFPVTGLRAPQ